MTVQVWKAHTVNMDCTVLPAQVGLSKFSTVQPVQVILCNIANTPILHYAVNCAIMNVQVILHSIIERVYPAIYCFTTNPIEVTWVSTRGLVGVALRNAHWLYLLTSRVAHVTCNSQSEYARAAPCTLRAYMWTLWINIDSATTASTSTAGPVRTLAAYRSLIDRI